MNHFDDIAEALRKWLSRFWGAATILFTTEKRKTEKSVCASETPVKTNPDREPVVRGSLISAARAIPEPSTTLWGKLKYDSTAWIC